MVRTRFSAALEPFLLGARVQVAAVHFTGLSRPQQWVDRLGAQQLRVAKLHAKRLGPPRPKSPLPKEQVLVRRREGLGGMID